MAMTAVLVEAFSKGQDFADKLFRCVCCKDIDECKRLYGELQNCSFDEIQKYFMGAYGVTPEVLSESDDLESFLKSWHQGLLDGLRFKLEWHDERAKPIELPGVSSGKYQVIIADPPWNYRNRQNGAAEKHYPTIKTKDIKALPVRKLANRDCVLLLWATNPCLPDAIEVIKAWGFEYKTAMPWIKVDDIKTLKPVYGIGHWVRGCSEQVLIAAKGKLKNIKAVEKINSLGILCSERFEHSRKPKSLHEYAEENFHGPYLELFACESMPGWDAFGNELGVNSITMPSDKGGNHDL